MIGTVDTSYVSEVQATSKAFAINGSEILSKFQKTEAEGSCKN